MERMYRHTHTHVNIETGGSDAATSQGPGSSAISEARSSEEGHFPGTFREDVTADTLIPKVHNPKLRENRLLLFKAAEFVAIGYSDPRELLRSPPRERNIFY